MLVRLYLRYQHHPSRRHQNLLQIIILTTPIIIHHRNYHQNLQKQHKEIQLLAMVWPKWLIDHRSLVYGEVNCYFTFSFFLKPFLFVGYFWYLFFASYYMCVCVCASVQRYLLLLLLNFGLRVYGFTTYNVHIHNDIDLIKKFLISCTSGMCS